MSMNGVPWTLLNKVPNCPSAFNCLDNLSARVLSLSSLSAREPQVTHCLEW